VSGDPCRLSHGHHFEPKSLIESIDESTGEVAFVL